MTNFTLLAFMALIALGIIWIRNLFAVVMLSGIFSLSAAALYVVLDAVDVAFTEAAVGAGIATVLMLALLSVVPAEEKIGKRPRWALPTVVVTGAVLIYGTFDMPRYGDPTSAIHHHVVPRYLEDSFAEVGMPNVVTSVLASYRGYDTLGETTVIFTAAIGVLGLIGRRRARKGRRQ